MTKEEYQSHSMAALREMAKSRRMTKISSLRKEQLVEALMENDRANTSGTDEEVPGTGKTGSVFMQGRTDDGTQKSEGKPAGEQTAVKEPEPASAAGRTERNITGRKGTNRSAGHSQTGRNDEQSQAGKSVEHSRTGRTRAQSSAQTGADEPLTADEIERRARQAAGRAGRGEQNRYSSQEQRTGQEQRMNRSRRVQTRDQRNSRNLRENRSSHRSDSRVSSGQMNRQDESRQEEYRRTQRTNSTEDYASSGREDGYESGGNSRNDYMRGENVRGEYSRRENTREDNARSDYARGENYRDGNTDAQSGQNHMNSSDRPPMELSSLDSGNTVTGVLEVMADGYGFIRSDNYMPGDQDVYVAPSQIRKFSLRTGDIISGNTRIRAQQEKFSALLYVNAVNGFPPSEAAQRRSFEDMTPIFPNYRLKMEREGGDISMRIVDLICPIGRGQRGMIVSQPKAGKTTLLKQIAHSILRNNPYMHIMIMLIDERPEEVTDIKEDIVGERVEVLYSTFDEEPEHHIRVARMGIERAKRLVEYGEHVTILLDSITRLARASNLTEQPSGRTLSGGLDPAALNMPKKFFGAARNMREGGSLTILATALIDTGSKMDDVVYEEFKGTGNMELVLDRKLSERRVFPAINIPASSTRREDLLLTRDEQEAVFVMRRALSSMKTEEATENILNLFVRTRTNDELVSRVRHQKYV